MAIFGWNLDTAIVIGSILTAAVVSLWIMRISWRRYGMLFGLASLIAMFLCGIFVYFGLYLFPNAIRPQFPIFHVLAVIFTFPGLVLVSVRYSPTDWKWKVPFYWAVVHLGISFEILLSNKTDILMYSKYWDTWDSYTWWWLYLLFFEWVGGKIVPAEARKPIAADLFHYGRPVWIAVHFILISTIFLAGMYVGMKLK